MVYGRNTAPKDAVVVREADESVHRVVAEVDERVSIEHGSGKLVYQGLRFDVDEIDDLIAALEECRDITEDKSGETHE